VARHSLPPDYSLPPDFERGGGEGFLCRNPLDIRPGYRCGLTDPKEQEGWGWSGWVPLFLGSDRCPVALGSRLCSLLSRATPSSIRQSISPPPPQGPADRPLSVSGPPAAAPWPPASAPVRSPSAPFLAGVPARIPASTAAQEAPHHSGGGGGGGGLLR